MTMFWLVLLSLVFGVVLFKFGVVTVWLGILEGLLKLLLVVSGGFLLVAAWRRLARRRAAP